MEKKDFERYLGKPFAVSLGKSRTVDLELAEVSALKKRNENGRESPFSLIFKGPGDRHLPDNTYDMTLSDGKATAIFISAHRKDGDTIYYDAVFT